MKIPIFVLGHASRSGLILPHLSRDDHTLYINPDWSLEGIKMAPLYKSRCPLNHYRVYRGWQEMAAAFLQTDHESALFFEDDAVPVRANWRESVMECSDWMYGRGVDLMYLCGRTFQRPRFYVAAATTTDTILMLRPGAVPQDSDGFGGLTHVFGCCAALMTRSGAQQMCGLPWTGVPGDAYFPDHIPFAFVADVGSPFKHDHSQVSIIDPNAPKEFM